MALGTAGFPPIDATLELFATWLPTKRWFPFKNNADELGSRLTLRSLLKLDGDLTGASPEVWIALVAVTGTREPDAVLQVPLTIYTGEITDPVPTEAIIGTLEGGKVLVDAPFDPWFIRTWLAGMAGRLIPGTAASLDWEGVSFTPPSDSEIAAAKVITSEQSNTSLVIPGDPGMILKVFRLLTPGLNPEILVPQAVASQDWPHVPLPLGWSTVHWSSGSPDIGDSDVPKTVMGHSAVLSEFIQFSEDGFEMACTWASDDQDFSDHSARLGATTAELHYRLAETFGYFAPQEPVELAADFARRSRWALQTVPGLRDFEANIAALHRQVAELSMLPPRQRLHGDLHLGQVRFSTELFDDSPRGWVFLDFEGEPLRPMAERVLPDLAVRDLAGMIRSMDYANAVGNSTSPTWAASARESFVAGYRARRATLVPDQEQASPEVEDLLLTAYELDKALYEAVYEAQNRPHWMSIPLAAVNRIVP